MRKAIWINTGLFAGLLLSGGVSLAQGSTPQPAETERAGASDQEFLKRAISNNQLELRLGHMAAERGSAPEIKAMGETMVQKAQRVGTAAERSGAAVRRDRCYRAIVRATGDHCALGRNISR
jgi:hypothetical protein